MPRIPLGHIVAGSRSPEVNAFNPAPNHFAQTVPNIDNLRLCLFARFSFTRSRKHLQRDCMDRLLLNRLLCPRRTLFQAPGIFGVREVPGHDFQRAVRRGLRAPAIRSLSIYYPHLALENGRIVRNRRLDFISHIAKGFFNRPLQPSGNLGPWHTGLFRPRFKRLNQTRRLKHARACGRRLHLTGPRLAGRFLAGQLLAIFRGLHVAHTLDALLAEVLRGVGFRHHGAIHQRRALRDFTRASLTGSVGELHRHAARLWCFRGIRPLGRLRPIRRRRSGGQSVAQFLFGHADHRRRHRCAFLHPLNRLLRNHRHAGDVLDHRHAAGVVGELQLLDRGERLALLTGQRRQRRAGAHPHDRRRGIATRARIHVDGRLDRHAGLFVDRHLGRRHVVGHRGNRIRRLRGFTDALQIRFRRATKGQFRADQRVLRVQQSLRLLTLRAQLLAHRDRRRRMFRAQRLEVRRSGQFHRRFEAGIRHQRIQAFDAVLAPRRQLAQRRFILVPNPRIPPRADRRGDQRDQRRRPRRRLRGITHAFQNLAGLVVRVFRERVAGGRLENLLPELFDRLAHNRLHQSTHGRTAHAFVQAFGPLHHGHEFRRTDQA